MGRKDTFLSNIAMGSIQLWDADFFWIIPWPTQYITCVYKLNHTAANFFFSCISFEEYQIVCILHADYQVYIWLWNVYSLSCVTQSGFLYTALPFSRAFRLFWMPYIFISLWIFEYLMWRPFEIWKKNIWKQILDELDCLVRVSVYFVFRLPKKNVKIRWLNQVQ